MPRLHSPARVAAVMKRETIGGVKRWTVMSLCWLLSWQLDERDLQRVSVQLAAVHALPRVLSVTQVVVPYKGIPFAHVRALVFGYVDVPNAAILFKLSPQVLRSGAVSEVVYSQ